MICSRCGKETAQIYVKRVSDEDVRVALCPACNRALFPNETGGLRPYSEKNKGKASRECPACGTTMEDFRRTGLLGCAHCYTAFAGELLPVIRSVQRAEQHGGSRPKGEATENYDRIRNLIDRRDALKDSIEQELRKGGYARAKALGNSLRAVDEELREINREIADRRD